MKQTQLRSTHLDREAPPGRIAKPLATESVAKKAAMKTLMVLLAAANEKREKTSLASRRGAAALGFWLQHDVPRGVVPEIGAREKELDL